MPSLSVRNLDDDTMLRLKRRAARHGRSAEAEVRAILSEALATETEPDFDRLAADLRALLAGRIYAVGRPVAGEPRRAMTDLVVDASVAIKWLLPEPDSPLFAVREAIHGRRHRYRSPAANARSTASRMKRV